MGWLIDPEEELVFVYFADRTLAIYEEANSSTCAFSIHSLSCSART
jgi:hypothetical protein